VPFAVSIPTHLLLKLPAEGPHQVSADPSAGVGVAALDVAAAAWMKERWNNRVEAWGNTGS